ncbi:RNA polymerase sigma factor [Bacillus sp. 166amftsu]|uniref:RNA polymerase sigma factor n=1 Tax=Bacillus sp. 166amftsu TaxID=1761753 RepID=UPI00089A61BE|nr:RNA polymerase sigma factor [Bacillus sp. 166amftsu]SDZ37695.1 RNA polymerase sigma-70 factor, ECF subfamily [Bacillus sp. 166amftsu]
MDFKEWIIPYQKDLSQYCYYLAGTKWDAEDLKQETMFKAFRYFKEIIQHPSPKAYLFKIASTVWADFYRKNPIYQIKLTENSNYNEDYESPFLLEEAMKILVSILPPQQATVYLLIDVFGFKPKEVALLLEHTEGGIKAALYRGRRKLKYLKNKYKSKGNIENNQNSQYIKEFIQAFRTNNPLLIRDAYILLSLNKVQIEQTTFRTTIFFSFTDLEGNILVVNV